MTDFITQLILGLVLIILGVIHAQGNISLLHSYHRKRVKEEDIKPFGKKLGTGCIIIGVTIMVAGLLTFLNYANISNIVLLIGLVAGGIFIFYALFKYNKGIF